MKILLIDDEPDIRRIAEVALSFVGGWKVVTAASGAEGLMRARAEAPDAILLDVMMPDMHGPDTFARLRDDPQTAQIPVIFMTAKPNEAEKYVALGARGVIRKPFDPMTLPAEISRILKV